MGFKQVLTGALIGLVSFSSLAANWITFVDKKEFSYAIDKNSIQKFESNNPKTTHKVWVKSTIKEDSYPLLKGDYAFMLYYINCDNKISGVKSITSFTENKVMEDDSFQHVEMTDAIPNSIQDNIMHLVCPLKR